MAIPPKMAHEQFLPSLENGHEVLLPGFGHAPDFWGYQPEASARLINTFLSSGEVDDSLYEPQPVDFTPDTTLPALAKGRDRCTLLVSPKDAGRIGLASGSRARVRSRVGEVVVPVEVSDEMMPGVVSLPHGFGHADPQTRLSVARARQPGACSNQLCDEDLMDLPSGTSVANGIPVEVAPA